MKINSTHGLIGLLLTACLFRPCLIHAQPIPELKIIDSVSFTSFKQGDSSFSNFITPNASIVHRQVGNYSATSLNQFGNYRVLVQSDSTVLSKIKLDTNGVLLNAGDTGNTSASLSLTAGKAEIKAKQIWFNGDWIRVPVPGYYETNPTPPLPLGSLFFSQKTRCLMASNGQNTGPAYWEYPDGDEVNPSVLLTNWTAQIGYENLPMVRVRHPKNVTNLNLGSASKERDFSIIPYEYGMAIDYNGVVECWVGEFSIHKGLYYATDVEKNGNTGWGGILWVGDDVDLGGIRATARNKDGIFYSEISSETFYGASHGPLRMRVVDSSDQFQFVHGGRGSNKQIFYMERKVDTAVFGAGQQLNLAIKTNDTTRLFVDKSGHTGIGTTLPQSQLDIKGSTGYDQLRLRTPYTPTGTSDPKGNTGDLSWDENYIYIKTLAGWKRTALESF